MSPFASMRLTAPFLYVNGPSPVVVYASEFGMSAPFVGSTSYET